MSLFLFRSIYRIRALDYYKFELYIFVLFCHTLLYMMTKVPMHSMIRRLFKNIHSSSEDKTNMKENLLEQFCGDEHVSQRKAEPGQRAPPNVETICVHERVRTVLKTNKIYSQYQQINSKHVHIQYRMQSNMDQLNSTLSIDHQLEKKKARFSFLFCSIY